MRRKLDMLASPIERSEFVKTIVTLGLQGTSVVSCLDVRLGSCAVRHVVRGGRKVVAMSATPTVAVRSVCDVLPIVITTMHRGMTVFVVRIESPSLGLKGTIGTRDASVVVMSLLSTTSKSDDRRETRCVLATRTRESHFLLASQKSSGGILLLNCVICGSGRQRSSKKTDQWLRGRSGGARAVP